MADYDLVDILRVRYKSVNFGAGKSHLPDARPLDRGPLRPQPPEGLPDYRGTSLIRNSHPPFDHHRALDINNCRVLGWGGFL